MDQMTVKELFEACKEQIEKGNGDKLIVKSSDNEGNSYTGLFYGFAENAADFIENIYDSVSTSPDKIIILG